MSLTGPIFICGTSRSELLPIVRLFDAGNLSGTTSVNYRVGDSCPTVTTHPSMVRYGSQTTPRCARLVSRTFGPRALAGAPTS